MHRSSRTTVAIAVAVALVAVGGFLLLSGDDEKAGEGARSQADVPTQTQPRTSTAPAKRPAKRRKRPAAPRGGGAGDADDARLTSFGGRGPAIGLADNVASNLIDPRFRSSGIKRVRVAVPFDDVARGGARRAYQDGYFRAAREVGVQPLVSFYRSYRGTRILPSEAQFRRHVRLFRKRYPWVRDFSTWNEANFRAQPTSRDPARTAAFYRILRDECSGGRCTVVTCDFRPDGTAQSARWLETFKRGIGGGSHTWGLAPYVDVNRRSTKLTRDFLARTKGPVWANEVGALNFFGKGVRPSLARQTKVMSFLVNDFARVSPRLQRIYVYHWRAAANNDLFDSGLLDAQGRPRPAYSTFLKAIGRSG